MRTKGDALRAARKAKALLKTRGWKINVWNNLGWCWSLDNLDGHFTLWQSEHTGRFTTLFSDGRHEHTGSYNWSTGSQSFKDPNKAVEAQIKLARGYVKRTAAWVDNLKKVS